MSTAPTDVTIDTLYERYFTAIGDAGVRDEQRAIIRSVLDGRDTLALMPTGGGKSLCYWISGLALGGTTVAVFPLTALMDEQAEKLRSFGLSVLVLHSGIDWRRQTKKLIDFANGQAVDFILVSPERLATDGLLERALHAAGDRVKLFVIDEIHCISQWGVDFRPFYKEFPYLIQTVWGDHPLNRPVLLGLTATLNQRDTEAILSDFQIPSDNVLRSRYLLRQEITLSVQEVSDDKAKDALLWNPLEQHREEKVLVYVENKNAGERSTEAMCATALERGFKAAFFHSGVSSDGKAQAIRDFKEGRIRTIFATSAFGMGIDIPDIRGVIHFRPPESIEQYYQQLGRVGRDGRPSWAKIYYSEKNFQFRKQFFIDRSLPTEQAFRTAFAEIFSGRGDLKTLRYFDDEGTRATYHYLLHSSAMAYLCKGLSPLNGIDISPGSVAPEWVHYDKASRTRNLITIATKCEEDPADVMRTIYDLLLSGRIRHSRSPERCLAVKRLAHDLPDDVVATALTGIEDVRKFKYEQLDLLKDLLDGFTGSSQLHQEIGRHLGIDEFSLGRVHQTLSGVWVRSKEEVIIANLLHERGIPFEYEAPLSADGESHFPDFTIRWAGGLYFWEHLGMLDQADYSGQMGKHTRLVCAQFPGQLITTQASPVLSKTAEAVIVKHFASGSATPAKSKSRRGWVGVLKLATEKERTLLSRLADVDAVPVPELGLETADGTPIDIAWRAQRIATGFGVDARTGAEWEGSGWTVVDPDPEVIAALFQ